MKLIDDKGVKCYTFGKEFGNAREDRSKISKFLKISEEQIIFVEQTHSDGILMVDEVGDYSDFKEDAMITFKPDLFLMVKVADCQGVCLYDPVRRVIAAVHSGWRGSVQNIIGKVVQKMVNLYVCDPADILAGVSPSLGPCCSQFSKPRKELPKEFHKYIGDANHVDFWKMTEDQLVEAGVLLENINNVEVCTVCNSDDYFSYRVEGENYGRCGVVIGMV